MSFGDQKEKWKIKSFETTCRFYIHFGQEMIKIINTM